MEEAATALFKVAVEALDEIKTAMDALTEKQKAENEYNVITSKDVPPFGWLKESIQSAILEGSLCWTDIDKAGKYLRHDSDKIVEDLYETIKRKLEATEITQSRLPKRIEAAIYDAVSQSPYCWTESGGSFTETLNHLEVGEIAENLCVVITDYVSEVKSEVVSKKKDVL